MGKVTAEECAFLLNYLSQQAQRYFSSWDHYLQSFYLRAKLLGIHQ
ncbi:DUF1266 domain-containing protein [Enterovibrio sp. Hal110]